jgi:hypothetical protein
MKGSLWITVLEVPVHGSFWACGEAARHGKEYMARELKTERKKKGLG